MFVLTGVLESMERDDAKSLIERLVGKSQETSAVKLLTPCLGRDSGASKTEKVLFSLSLFLFIRT